ncbi:MAG TPA: AzlC family ABC transporter permease [Xanthobacteraceae bacterium]
MSADPERPRWTRAGIVEGVRLSLPVVPGTIVMAAAIGALAAQKGLTLTETTLMSALVFAGASQLVALEVWTPAFTLSALLTVALVTGIVNLRYILMTASLRPWLAQMPAWQVYPALMLTVDAGWIIAMRYRAEGGRDAGVFLGTGLIMWVVWWAGTIPGHLLGGLIHDPRPYGLDLALPAFFAAMLVPLWRGPRWAISWVVAGGVALAVSWLVPGWWFIIAGALAGSVTGGFIDESR